MKKKGLLLLGMMLLAGSLSACQGTEEGQASAVQGGNAVTAETDVQVSGEAEEEADYPEGLDYLYTENHFGYSLRLPGRENSTVGYGHVAKEQYEGGFRSAACLNVFVTQYSGDVGAEEEKELIDMSQYHSSADIFQVLSPLIQHQFFSGLSVKEISYDVDILETTTINGFEMTKFEGEMDYVDAWGEITYPIVAYGIAGTETPVLVCCIDETEERSRHADWVDKIDEVVSTYTEN
ncbi:MAG TPA: hypothetical protein H9742_07865 [Candidatus Acetatifactor stercoripullorum]|uniref:Lipoprotein n=1 Tax=Candidatus Acetatifactor stercoripullorum TaxID=2838414 RepID=A0A9D1UB73_9FIRM|nr:hypothetical protein [uncultured Acetatifactor sp.]HIW81417.1 hypothetical protein [Candidatus Acetatifactor stercoripullorum]